MEPQSYQISSIEPGVLATSQTIDPETQPRLRVLLDARKIGDGGIGVYTASLASGIVATGKIELTLLVRNPQALRGLEQLTEVLSAITGAQTDRMTRDDGWRLLSIGRHIERLGFLAASLELGFSTGSVLTIKGGQFDGERVMRSTAPQLSKQSKLAEVIEGILGRELTDKELQGGFDLDELIDKECNILVLQSKSKAGVTYSNVERVFCT